MGFLKNFLNGPSENNEGKKGLSLQPIFGHITNRQKEDISVITTPVVDKEHAEAVFRHEFENAPELQSALVRSAQDAVEQKTPEAMQRAYRALSDFLRLRKLTGFGKLKLLGMSSLMTLSLSACGQNDLANQVQAMSLQMKSMHDQVEEMVRTGKSTQTRLNELSGKQFTKADAAELKQLLESIRKSQGTPQDVLMKVDTMLAGMPSRMPQPKDITDLSGELEKTMPPMPSSPPMEGMPSGFPYLEPSNMPSKYPADYPTGFPSEYPSSMPSDKPSASSEVPEFSADNLVIHAVDGFAPRLGEHSLEEQQVLQGAIENTHPTEVMDVEKVSIAFNHKPVAGESYSLALGDGTPLIDDLKITEELSQPLVQYTRVGEITIEAKNGVMTISIKLARDTLSIAPAGMVVYTLTVRNADATPAPEEPAEGEEALEGTEEQETPAPKEFDTFEGPHIVGVQGRGANSTISITK